jgi:hypothetical protein
MSDSNKTREEQEKLEEQELLMHILRMGPADGNGICVNKCSDELCNAGCTRQRAKCFRPQIMQAIKYLRNNMIDWDKYPLYADAALNPIRKCELYPNSDCLDPVCGVAGCLEKPAFYYRNLIAIALREEEIKK